MYTKHPLINFGTGIAFALLSVLIFLLSIGISNGALINSRFIPTIYSGLIGGPISILVCTLTIVFSRDFFGEINELSVIMKWNTLFSGIILALFAYFKPISFKNIHYYFFISLVEIIGVLAFYYISNHYDLRILFVFGLFSIVSFYAIYLIILNFKKATTKIHSLKKLHLRDYLTDLSNNLATEEYLQQLLNKKIPFELLQIDIDSFKNFNAKHTYKIGDEILKQFSSILKEVGREQNAYVGRMGGDEFCIILTDSNPASAVQFAYNLNKRITSTPFIYNDCDYTITISICISSFPENGQSLEEIYNVSIEGLKLIKETNTVRHVNQLIQSGELHLLNNQNH